MKTNTRGVSPTLTGNGRRGQPLLMLLSVGLVLAGAAACVQPGPASSTPTPAPGPTQPSTEPPAAATATLEVAVPADWETYSNTRFQYAISYPPAMEGAASGDYSWMLSFASAEPGLGPRNFIYVSVIPAGFQSGGGDIYNYNTPEAEILLNLQVGERRSVHGGDNAEDGFTFTRLPDTTFGDLPAQVYENIQPWEFPPGTKELRYYVSTEANTYLLGGYMDTTGSGPAGTITEALFNQIVATFRIAP